MNAKPSIWPIYNDIISPLVKCPKCGRPAKKCRFDEIGDAYAHISRFYTMADGWQEIVTDTCYVARKSHE